MKTKAARIFSKFLGAEAANQKKLLKDFQTFQKVSSWEAMFASTVVSAHFHKTSADCLFGTLLDKLNSAAAINLDLGKISGIEVEDYGLIIEDLMDFLKKNPGKIKSLSINIPKALDETAATRFSDNLVKFFDALPEGLKAVKLNLAPSQTGQLTPAALNAMGTAKNVSITLDDTPFSKGTYTKPLLTETTPLLDPSL